MAKMEHDKADEAADKKLIKKAFAMHDKQEHPGKKTDLSALKKGGGVKKMASGGFVRSADGIASKGKTKAKQITMCGGGKVKK